MGTQKEGMLWMAVLIHEWEEFSIKRICAKLDNTSVAKIFPEDRFKSEYWKILSSCNQSIWNTNLKGTYTMTWCRIISLVIWRSNNIHRKQVHLRGNSS